MIMAYLSDYWHIVRWWLASQIVGINLEDEIDAAYEAGFYAGKTKMFTDVSDFFGSQ